VQLQKHTNIDIAANDLRYPFPPVDAMIPSMTQHAPSATRPLCCLSISQCDVTSSIAGELLCVAVDLCSHHGQIYLALPCTEAVQVTRNHRQRHVHAVLTKSNKQEGDLLSADLRRTTHINESRWSTIVQPCRIRSSFFSLVTWFLCGSESEKIVREYCRMLLRKT
jgi:hypothetical protein